MGTLDRIIQMGEDPQVTVEQIDILVNQYMAFLKWEQLLSPEVNLSQDIFQLEAARQQAMMYKYRK